MSGILRILAISLPLLLPLGAGNRSSATFGWNRAADDALLSRTALLVARAGPHDTATWLRHQPSVQWAGVGRDGRTVVMLLRDGIHEAVLPSVQRRSVAPRQLGAVAANLGWRIAHRPVASRDRLAAQSDAPRAAVLEPFAGELALGPTAGDAETEYLRYAGYAVDRARDTDVTVATLASLSQYPLIYLNTHSGVNQYGEGVVASGELEDGNPAVTPLLKDGTVYVVGVDGTSQRYYGVLSSFVTKHMGQFTPGSILFINGCSLLRATLFWQALAQKGVATMISFSDDVAPTSARLASTIVFSALVRGSSVADAVAGAANYSSEITNATGGPAHLGYVGDGSLHIRSQAPTPIATPPPSPTPSFSLSPVPTQTPALTPTLAPPPRPLDRGLEVYSHPSTYPATCVTGSRGRDAHCVPSPANSGPRASSG